MKDSRQFWEKTIETLKGKALHFQDEHDENILEERTPAIVV